ncbi:MAG TPA: methyltransferase domain-containing protein [Candidatus Binataceae bacterium]|nr:methyltransferase domain-containing protein [Candidatus Binataceae bacterium]
MANDEASRAQTSPGLVAQYFGRLAKDYGDGEFYLRRREACVAALADEIARARRILDLGCGNGRYLDQFRKIAPDAFAIGVDLTHEMLLEARVRCGIATPLIRADAHALPLRAGALDLIFASHVFQFIDDKDAAMIGLVRNLESAGAIVITVGGSGVREMLAQRATPAQWERLAAAVFPSRRRIVAMEAEEVHREAMRRAGLAVETRDVRFALTWNGLVEWIDLRWSRFMDAGQRRVAAEVLGELAPTLSSRAFDLTERLLIGRKSQ